MKIIHFAGIRLGASYPEWPEQADRIRRSLKELLIQLFERAQADSADALISAGDMFDSNNVAMSDVETVTELCAAYPDIPLILVPGSRDPWGPHSIYHHLITGAPANLHIVTPNPSEPIQVIEGLWIYAVARDSASERLPSLKEAERTDHSGAHVAVVCSDLGRPKPGPEEGMVMVSPAVTHHPFDYVALGDCGAADSVGHQGHPACYAGAPSVHTAAEDAAAVAWLVDFGEKPARTARLELRGIVRKEAALDVTRVPDEQAAVAAIARMGDEHTLLSIVLTGTRPADRPIMDQTVLGLARGHLLGMHILDATELVAPDALRTDQPAMALLWDRYRQAPAEERAMWADALKLYSAGVTDPARWPEAPWAR